MARLTRKHVEFMIHHLNETLDLPVETYVLDEETGERIAQIGCIHLVRSGTGFTIYQLVNDAGACRSLACSLSTAEAHNWIIAALAGVTLARTRCGC
jgi:hypothetical protein